MSGHNRGSLCLGEGDNRVIIPPGPRLSTEYCFHKLMEVGSTMNKTEIDNLWEYVGKELEAEDKRFLDKMSNQEDQREVNWQHLVHSSGLPATR